MRAHLYYLKYVLRHKWFVFWACLKMGVPFWIALFHDWDKFLSDEWFAYVHTFYAPDGSKQYKESAEFSIAWLLHQNRNKHHWQYWILTWDRGTFDCQEMPDVYRREMIADWIGAGKALGFPNTWEWYEKNRTNIQLHPTTRIWVDNIIAEMKDKYLTQREKISDVQHEIWASWMRWVFQICPTNDDGTVTIPADKVERWQRQIKTPYESLTEKEKDSDREQADKVLAVIK